MGQSIMFFVHHGDGCQVDGFLMRTLECETDLWTDDYRTNTTHI